MPEILGLEITYLPIHDLRLDPANPRRISDEELEALTRSVREFGLIDPIIARREDKVVIGGHQRLLAARKLGLKQVPVVLVDLSEERAHLLNIALNRISASWDQELLARLLSDLNAVPDIDLSLTGFSDDELKKHLKAWSRGKNGIAWRPSTWKRRWKPPSRPPWPTRATFGC